MTFQEVIAHRLSEAGHTILNVKVDREASLYGGPATEVVVLREFGSGSREEILTITKANQVSAEGFARIFTSYLR